MPKQTTFEYLHEVSQKTSTLIEEADSGLGFLGVVVGNLPMYIPTQYVYKVISHLSITSVCHTQPWLQGIAQVDGNIYSVYNLGRWFDISLDSAAKGGNKVIALSQTGGYHGLLVEEILGLTHVVLGEMVSETPLTQEYKNADNGDVFSVLSVEKLVDSAEFSNFSIFN